MWNETAPSIRPEDYQVALATFRTACEPWPGAPITAGRAGDRRQSPNCAWPGLTSADRRALGSLGDLGASAKRLSKPQSVPIAGEARATAARKRRAIAIL